MDNQVDLLMGRVTPELQAKHIAAVSSHHGKNEKLAWKRKIKKMEGIIAEIGKFEEQILEIVKQKQPLMDDIALLRAEMVRECIHPRDHLVHMGTMLTCKFCNNNISIPRIFSQTLKVEESEDESE
jgi:hypothetical protein